MMDSTIRFGSEVCADVERASRLEWLETNGIGGFASSSIVGMNTRRYHALLTAATRPPVGRVIMLSKLEETLIVDGKRFELSVNRYPGVVHPEGFRYLCEFRLDPCPTFVYEAGGIHLEKRVFMVQGENTTVVEYAITGAATLELRPLIAVRDFHSTSHENSAFNSAIERHDGVIKLTPYAGMPPLYLFHDGATVGAGCGWYRNFEYDRERERGLEFREDLYNPAVFTFEGSGRIVASLTEHPAATAVPVKRTSATLVGELARAAEQFIVARGSGKSVIAGYHWFGDWGRDTMIALPGLTLVTGRFEVARQILDKFAQVMDRGMLPNRFPDAGQAPEYNTVDATLWFFEAVRAYAKYTGDYAFVRDRLYACLKDAVEWHLRGTRYGIRVDSDALLACGEPGVQLTWMDAKVGDWVVTPRRGKPVEIQALWYNALRIMEDLARRFQEPSFGAQVRELAERVSSSFHRQFWKSDCLADVIDGDTRDDSIRPNQIFAVSLTHSMLDADQWRKVVEVVERELLTPMGLRSLSPRDQKYRGRYEGDVKSRDSAYHQGTVWPWLMGPFLTAYVRVHGDAGRARAAALLEHFREVMRSRGLAQIPEIADGDAPHESRGCIAQAWSVAELLRAAVEDTGMSQAEMRS
jgi:glycogen debranching enzyme